MMRSIWADSPGRRKASSRRRKASSMVSPQKLNEVTNAFKMAMFVGLERYSPIAFLLNPGDPRRKMQISSGGVSE